MPAYLLLAATMLLFSSNPISVRALQRGFRSAMPSNTIKADQSKKTEFQSQLKRIGGDSGSVEFSISSQRVGERSDAISFSISDQVPSNVFLASRTCASLCQILNDDIIESYDGDSEIMGYQLLMPICDVAWAEKPRAVECSCLSFIPADSPELRNAGFGFIHGSQDCLLTSFTKPELECSLTGTALAVHPTMSVHLRYPVTNIASPEMYERWRKGESGSPFEPLGEEDEFQVFFRSIDSDTPLFPGTCFCRSGFIGHRCEVDMTLCEVQHISFEFSEGESSQCSFNTVETLDLGINTIFVSRSEEGEFIESTSFFREYPWGLPGCETYIPEAFPPGHVCLGFTWTQARSWSKCSEYEIQTAFCPHRGCVERRMGNRCEFGPCRSSAASQDFTEFCGGPNRGFCVSDTQRPCVCESGTNLDPEKRCLTCVDGFEWDSEAMKCVTNGRRSGCFSVETTPQGQTYSQACSGRGFCLDATETRDAQCVCRDSDGRFCETERGPSTSGFTGVNPVVSSIGSSSVPTHIYTKAEPDRDQCDERPFFIPTVAELTPMAICSKLGGRVASANETERLGIHFPVHAQERGIAPYVYLPEHRWFQHPTEILSNPETLGTVCIFSPCINYDGVSSFSSSFEPDLILVDYNTIAPFPFTEEHEGDIIFNQMRGTFEEQFHAECAKETSCPAQGISDITGHFAAGDARGTAARAVIQARRFLNFLSNSSIGPLSHETSRHWLQNASSVISITPNRFHNMVVSRTFDAAIGLSNGRPESITTIKGASGSPFIDGISQVPFASPLLPSYSPTRFSGRVQLKEGDQILIVCSCGVSRLSNVIKAAIGSTRVAIAPILSEVDE